ncbi:uncharacterized protein N7518_010411 [Penicillium psychrosexuale]|uniref:uncharacterized protein n=1 Tax=Penicillium psychrosexuale TaxID=1002107 RepID=UPI0025451450|nr:uncharacterized protein N7518_010411 [Penicillium psychrosexuale]KAJ5781928.1 hypothetical protein N7518_010411 [Penicillium psychrosexuale]
MDGQLPFLLVGDALVEFLGLLGEPAHVNAMVDHVEKPVSWKAASVAWPRRSSRGHSRREGDVNTVATEGEPTMEFGLPHREPGKLRLLNRARISRLRGAPKSGVNIDRRAQGGCTILWGSDTT